MLSLKPDFEKTRARYDAFWHGAVVDRPPVDVSLPRPGAAPIPRRQYANWDEQWVDVDFRAEQIAAQMEATDFAADSLPVAFPNLGPEIYSAWCGCEYHFTADSGWSSPLVHDWQADIGKARLNREGDWFRLSDRFTQNLMELGKGRFLTGLGDFHPGGDHLAALRDPQTLAMDLIEYPEEVKAELTRSQREYFAVYDHYYDTLRAGGSLACSWMGSLFGEGKFYIPSNDFSCMISTAMFEEFFLPGIAAECRFLDQSIYHLDGPGALRHLDSLLAIPELKAVQWVCGAGNEGYARWVEVYRRIQRAGKGIALYVTLAELPMVFETLRPEGVWFAGIGGVHDPDTLDAVLRRIERWE